jgi:hypothetical protein
MKKWFNLIYILYAGLTPIIGLIFFDWDALGMITFFWYENFLFFAFNITRIWLVNDFVKSDKAAWYSYSGKYHSKKREFVESFFFINFISLLVYAGWIFMFIVPLTNRSYNFLSNILLYSFYLFLFEIFRFILEFSKQNGKFSKNQLFPRVERTAYFRMVIMHLSLFFGIFLVYSLGAIFEIKKPPVFLIGVILSFIYLLTNIAENITANYEQKECRYFVRMMDKLVTLIRILIFVLSIPAFFIFGLMVSISFFVLSHLLLIFIRALLIQILLKLNINKDIRAPGAY